MRGSEQSTFYRRWGTSIQPAVLPRKSVVLAAQQRLRLTAEQNPPGPLREGSHCKSAIQHRDCFTFLHRGKEHAMRPPVIPCNHPFQSYYANLRGGGES